MTAPLNAHPTVPKLNLAAARRKQPQHSVPSPCVGICKMNTPQGWCGGCFRTIEEITAWSRATDATKLQVWAQVEQRQQSRTA